MRPTRQPLPKPEAQRAYRKDPLCASRVTTKQEKVESLTRQRTNTGHGRNSIRTRREAQAAHSWGGPRTQRRYFDARCEQHMDKSDTGRPTHVHDIGTVHEQKCTSQHVYGNKYMVTARETDEDQRRWMGELQSITNKQPWQNTHTHTNTQP